MMWARIEDGRVAEITDIDPQGRFHPSLAWVQCGADVLAGWSGEGGEFAPPIQIQPAKPSSCTPAQGLVALFALKNVKEEEIAAVIESIPDPVQRYTAQVAYRRATEWTKESLTFQVLAAALNLSDADLDELFAYAVTVQV